MSHRSRLFCTYLLVTACFVTVHAAPDATADPTWPQWRGPNRDAKVSGRDWPGQLKGLLKEQWEVKLDRGYSGPIVSDELVFTFETVDRKVERVRALDRQTGKERWRREWKGAMSVPFFARANGSWVRSTPTYDGESLFVAGMRDVLVSIDAKTGKENWRVNFPKRDNTPVPSFGFVCSPLVVGGAVYVQAGAAFVKLDKKTGKTLWKALDDGGGMYGSAFSSPVLATLHGTPQLIVQTRQKLAGVDEQTGRVLWSQEIRAFRGMNILTPLVSDNSIFTAAYGGKAYRFDVTLNEQGEWAVSQAWSNRMQGYMSSPVLIDGHVYHHARNQRFHCIDLKDGAVKWTTDRPFGKYWSMVANQGRVLALDQRGTLYLIDARPQGFQLLDEIKVADDSWAHLAVAGDQVFVRELEGLTVYRWATEE